MREAFFLPFSLPFFLFRLILPQFHFNFYCHASTTFLLTAPDNNVPYSFNNATHITFTVDKVMALIKAKRHYEANQLGTTFLLELITGNHVHKLNDFQQDSIAKMLDTTNVDLKARSNWGETLLHSAVRRASTNPADVHLVRLLLFTNATEVNAQSDDGLFTALHLAVEYNNPLIVSALLDDGRVDGTIVDVNGRTAVHAAVLRSDLKTLQMLIEHFPSTMFMKDYLGDTPLLLAQRAPVMRPLLALISKGTSSTKRIVMPPIKYRYIQLDKLKGSGKWRQQQKQQNKVQCDIDIIDAKYDHNILEMFVNEYFSKSKPVIIKNIVKYWKGRTMFRRSKMLMRRNKIKYQTSTNPYKNSTLKTVSSYVKNCMRGSIKKKERNKCAKNEIFFDRINAKWCEQSTNGIPVFASICKSAYPGASATRSPQLIISTKFGGAPFHDHQSALNALFYGTKDWLLVPPNFAHVAANIAASVAASAFDESSGVDKDGGQGKKRVWNLQKQKLKELGVVAECTQVAGDLLFIPRMWMHATNSLEESVAVNYEFCTAVGSEKFAHLEKLSAELYGGDYSSMIGGSSTGIKKSREFEQHYSL
jgi:hypothetical protein